MVMSTCLFAIEVSLQCKLKDIEVVHLLLDAEGAGVDADTEDGDVGQQSKGTTDGEGQQLGDERTDRDRRITEEEEPKGGE